MLKNSRVTDEELAAWRSSRALARANELASLTVCLGDPWETATAVAVRIEQLRVSPTASTVPTDVFVLGVGEPPVPFWTKVFGTPYRPAALPWPVTPSGVPYRFFFQLDFSASRDLFEDLPGDILVVFSISSDPATDVLNSLYFEWHPIGLTDILSQESSIDGDRNATLFFGRPCRTFDFVDTETICEVFRSQRAACKESNIDVPTHPWNSARFLGFKVGGLPCWQHDGAKDAHWAVPFKPSEEVCKNLLYLGGIGAFAPRSDVQLPWINRSEPIPLGSDNACDYLLMYDGFQIHLFLDSDSHIQWAMEFP